MAYSDINNNKTYRCYRNMTAAKKIFIFCAITSLAAYCLFTSKHINTITAAVLAAAAAAVCFYLVKLQLIFDKTYDGEVIAKEKSYTYSKTAKMVVISPVQKGALDKQGNIIPYVRSELRVRCDNGKIRRHVYVEHDESKLVCYYRMGDRVRHHAGLNLYEKEDKSQDRRILCLRCLSLEPKENEKCNNCGFILIK
jgi:hypothetical protein